MPVSALEAVTTKHYTNQRLLCFTLLFCSVRKSDRTKRDAVWTTDSYGLDDAWQYNQLKFHFLKFKMADSRHLVKLKNRHISVTV